MKKLFTMIVFFMSSFFLFGFQVKAETASYEISSTELAKVNDQSISCLQKIRDFAKKNNKHYYIYNQSGVYLFDDSTPLYLYWRISNRQLAITTNRSVDRYSFSVNSCDLKQGDTINSTELVLWLDSLSDWYSLFDTDVDVIYNGPTEFSFYSENYSYTVSQGSKVQTLYQFYLSKNNLEDVKEDDIITKFYTLCTEKIELLVNLFLDNSVFLTIFCIFIFVFVIELVWRRFL